MYKNDHYPPRHHAYTAGPTAPADFTQPSVSPGHSHLPSQGYAPPQPPLAVPGRFDHHHPPSAPGSNGVVQRSGGRPPSVRPRSMAGVVGSSSEVVALYAVVDRVADTACTVLITGESGTGKEHVARAVHEHSGRRRRNFVAVNCGAIPENLLETELFGHVKGAFTGAHTSKIGKVGLADGGTLFLDEVGELPLSLQVKLLRVLQSHEYSVVGDARTLKADVRVVAATNIDLEQAVERGAFRRDLFYRLNVIHLKVPPLRHRTSDISILTSHFIALGSKKTGRPAKILTHAAHQLLLSYQWPGNVRELENTIERATLLSTGERIEPEDLPERLREVGANRSQQSGELKLPESGINLRAAVESFENELIRQALERTGWNKNRAAMLLSLNRTTLVEMLKRKRISRAA